MKHHPLQYLLIPFTLLTYLASALLSIVYRPSSIRIYKGMIEMVDSTPDSRSTTIWGRPGGQGLGCRVNWFNTTLGLEWAPLRVHERIHTIHGEWVNGLAHLILVPMAAICLGGWWIVAAIVLAQLAFGISYGGHFMIEWARGGFNANWRPAYMRIWTERIAYRKQAEFEAGKHPDAWGA